MDRTIAFQAGPSEDYETQGSMQWDTHIIILTKHWKAYDWIISVGYTSLVGKALKRRNLKYDIKFHKQHGA